MGHYTDFKLFCELKANTPEDIKQSLVGLVNGILVKPQKAHPFFDSDRPISCIHGAGDYFLSLPVCRFEEDECGDWILEVNAASKNLDHEIEKFLNWLTPYIYTEEEALGYFRSERSNLPTVFLIEDGKLKFYSCEKEIPCESYC